MSCNIFRTLFWDTLYILRISLHKSLTMWSSKVVGCHIVLLTLKFLSSRWPSLGSTPGSRYLNSPASCVSAKRFIIRWKSYISHVDMSSSIICVQALFSVMMHVACRGECCACHSKCCACRGECCVWCSVPGVLCLVFCAWCSVHSYRYIWVPLVASNVTVRQISFLLPNPSDCAYRFMCLNQMYHQHHLWWENYTHSGLNRDRFLIRNKASTSR